MRVPLHILMSVFVGLGTAAHAPASDIRQLEPSSQDRDGTAIIPFDLYRDFFIVTHGSVGPLKNLNFFLDSGTTVPVLDAQIAKKLKLQAQGPSDIVTTGGSARAENATLPSIELGPVQRFNLQILIADLSFFQKSIPVRIDAIIGLDMLGQTPFVIDYSSHLIRFGPAAGLLGSVPLRLDRGLPVFDAEIDHRPVHLLFDTGASSLVLFAGVTAENLGTRSDTANEAKEIGKFDSKQVWLSTLRLGSEEFRQKPAQLALNPKPSQFDFDGLMSPRALGISRISVDLKGGVLGFSR